MNELFMQIEPEKTLGIYQIQIIDHTEEETVSQSAQTTCTKACRKFIAMWQSLWEVPYSSQSRALCNTSLSFRGHSVVAFCIHYFIRSTWLSLVTPILMIMKQRFRKMTANQFSQLCGCFKN